jgi:hypothetical protein
MGPHQTNEEKFRELRSVRQAKLIETDYTQLVDCQLSGLDKQKYTTYRQALRDLPATISDISNINDIEEISWPEL